MSDPARLSLRAQLALWAAAVALLSSALGVAVLVPAVQRAARAQAEEEAVAFAQVLAGGIVAACEDAPDRPACERRVASRLEPGPRAAPSARAGSVLGLGLMLTGLNALGVFLALYAVLVRVVARPAERLLAATDRIGQGDRPLLAGEGPVLGRLGTAFDRMGQRLDEERTEVESRVAELRRVNRQLAEAKDAIVRTEKLATVGRLSAGVAHEIGNPLAAILGYLELLKLKGGGGEYVERMEREVKRIDRIVRDLLDFSRPGARAEVGPVSPREVIERTVRLVEPQKRFREVAIRTEVAEDLPAVLAESHYLQQVILNLLVNAADAMDGKGEIELRCRVVEAPARAGRRAGDLPAGPRVVLTVRDRGPGIPAAQLPKIFDPFFTTKEPGKGTGLGLSICHSLVESFGGRISAANAEGGGAELTLELRVATPEGASPSASMPA